MAKRRVELEWSLADVLKDKGITAGQFIEDAQKLDPSCTRDALERCLRGKNRRINLNLLGVIVSVLDCQIEDLLSQREKEIRRYILRGGYFLSCLQKINRLLFFR